MVAETKIEQVAGGIPELLTAVALSNLDVVPVALDLNARTEQLSR